MAGKEHPDMGGNICDEPFVCSNCGAEILDEGKAYGVYWDDSILLCSDSCAEDYENKRYEERYEI